MQIAVANPAFRESRYPMNVPTLEVEKEALRIPYEVKALLSALKVSEPDTASLERLSDAEWTRLLAFSDIAHLTLPTARLALKGSPNWVAERLKENLEDNAIRFERVKATYREAANALDRAGVDHLVIKGFTQAPDYVAEPRFRLQSDIDIFCQPKTIDTAESALLAIGYESSGKSFSLTVDHEPILVRTADWRWRGNLFDPEMPLGIELHFCLWNERVSHILMPEVHQFWERRTKREIDGFSFSCLSSIDHLAHFTLHILRNIFLGDWIVHHVRELAVFLHTHADDDKFWRAWNEQHSASLRTMGAVVFCYARAWFNCRLHPVAVQEIERIPAMRRSWLRHFSGSALEVMFEQNKDVLWLQLSFASSPMEKLRVLRETLIPVRIGSIDSPVVKVRNKRLIRNAGSHPLQQYVSYLVSRTAEHGRANLSTLGRGLGWHLSQQFSKR
jgi:hypothetical protein